MPFRTKIDFSDNRQAKQRIETIQELSGATHFGVPFSSLPTGPNPSTSGVSETYGLVVSTFSGNSGTTNYSWYDSRMSLGEPYLSALTPSNSATTQNTGDVFVSSSTTIIDGNTVNLAYTGVSFGLNSIYMVDLGGGNYSGSVTSTTFNVLSATSIDFTGRTIWADISGITRTEKLIVTNSPVVGYVLTCADTEGLVSWAPSSGGTSGGTSMWSAGTGTNAVVLNNSGSIATGILSYAEGILNQATGDYAHAEGGGTKATGLLSHAEGRQTTAAGDYSHAEGSGTTATGDATYAHVEGYGSQVLADASHAEGWLTSSIGDYGSHSEGSGTTASGQASHAEGRGSYAAGLYSHAEGYGTTASGQASHAEGIGTIATGTYSHAEGSGTLAIMTMTHAEGGNTTASGYTAHAEGYFSTAEGDVSHAEGWYSRAIGQSSHAEGNTTFATGQASHAEGQSTIAIGYASHAEGYSTTATGFISHTEGSATTATGSYSHAENVNTKATGEGSHAEGNYTTASGDSSHAEGYYTTAIANYSHAEGQGSKAAGSHSHAEGDYTSAYGQASHAEGSASQATAQNTHAEGYGTVASNNEAHAEGNQTTASGIASHSEGQYTIASGNASHSGGRGWSTSKVLYASGFVSFNHSYHDNSVSQLSGASSDYSAILGGTNQEILSSSNNSVIIGGSDNKINGAQRSVVIGGSSITATTSDYVYVPSLNVKTVGSSAFANDIRIDANGNLTTNTSDARLKENIQPITNALAKVNALQGVTYQWKDRSAGGDAVKLGFIAQEVENVDPNLVFTNKVDGYKGLHIDGIIPLLVESVKELCSGITTSNNTHLETQTILAEDNNIDLNYGGTQATAVGGGITVLEAIGEGLSAKFITDSEGNWITNNDLKPNSLTIPKYTPTSSNDTAGKEGNITRDDNYLYIKTANGWKRSNLESF